MRQWHAILMQPSSVVGKSLGQPALLFQREPRTNSEPETHRLGINRAGEVQDGVVVVGWEGGRQGT